MRSKHDQHSPDTQGEMTGVDRDARGRLSREHVGDVPESAKVMWHNQAVLTSFTWFGRKAQKWDQRNPDLQSFAHLAVAALTGCSRCLDFGYLAAHNEGLDEAKDNEVPRWRESTVVTSLERDVIEHTEAMVGERPPRIADEWCARLLEQVDAPAMVEFTASVAFANMSTWCNTALGIEAQGFSKACTLQLAQPCARYATSA